MASRPSHGRVRRRGEGRGEGGGGRNKRIRRATRDGWVAMEFLR